MAVIEPRGRGYRARVRLKGFPPQSAAFERLTDARRWAQQTEAAIREGRHFKTVEAKKHTVGELIDRYIADVLPTKPKSRDKQEPQLRWWKAQIGVYLLSDVTPSLLAQCRDRLAAQATRRGPTHSPSTVLRYIAVLSHAFSVAVKEWGWLEDNPMRKVTKPKEPKGRVRFLSDDVLVNDSSRLTKYEFGTRTAEYHMCTRCGVVPVVTSRIEDRLYAVVNVNTFEGVDQSLLRHSTMSFDGEDAAIRLARRKRNWIGNVLYTERAT